MRQHFGRSRVLRGSWAEGFDFSVHHREEFYAVGHQATFSELIVHLTKAAQEITGCNHILWTSPVTPLFNEEQFVSISPQFKEYQRHQQLHSFP